jgi:hypothetical protein
MAISWAQGLLAGAAGVAEYSNQQQDRRQKRMDRTHELQNQMRMTHAKSAYASKVKEYEKNKSTLKALEGMEAGSLTEQVALHRALGFSEKASFAAAQSAVAAGKPLQRPGAVELPEFEIPNMMQGQASSPVQDWARNIRKSFSTEPQALPEQPVAEETPAYQPGVYPSPSEFGQAVPATLETESPVVPGEPITTSGGISAQDQMTIDALAPKVEYQIKSRTGVQADQSGTFYDYVDPTSPGKIQTTFVPSGKAAAVRIDDITVENPDGSKDLQPRFIDPGTNKITMGAQVRINPKDPRAPAVLIKPQDINDFINTGGDDEPKGELHFLLPEDSMAKIQDSSVFQEEGLLWGTNDNEEKLEQFQYSVGSSYLRQQQAAYADGDLLSGDQTDTHSTSDFKKLWLGTSIIETLGPSQTAQLVRDGVFDQDMFIGAELNDSPQIQQIQKELGILTQVTDEETGRITWVPSDRDTFNKLTNAVSYSM